MISHLFK